MSEVYSWRVSTDLKTGLERAARSRKISVSAALELAAREWLRKSATNDSGDKEQLRLHAAAAQSLGVLAGGDSHRAENARASVRLRLQRRHER